MLNQLLQPSEILQDAESAFFMAIYEILVIPSSCPLAC